MVVRAYHMIETNVILERHLYAVLRAPGGMIANVPGIVQADILALDKPLRIALDTAISELRLYEDELSSVS